VKQEEKILSILEKSGLKKTQSRIEVLRFYINENKALSHSEVEQELGNTFDRVTLYRILKAFEKEGIIHSIATEGATKYALSHLHNNKIGENHFHFHCNKCKKTFCLPETSVPKFNFPKNLKVTEVNLNAVGVCENCV